MTHYQPTQPHHWALIGGHLWRATKHGAYRKDCLMPTHASGYEGSKWLDATQFEAKVGAWLAVPLAPADWLPYPRRYAPLFKVYAVHAGPFPSSVTLFRGEEPVAFVMANDPRGRPCSQSIGPTGQSFHTRGIVL